MITKDHSLATAGMATPQIDYGQAEIAVFREAVSSGALHFDPAACLEAKDAYDELIQGLREIKGKLYKATVVSGFGGFQSAIELQEGFRKKAVDGMAALDQLIDGAMQLQETYLRAGGLMEEADAVYANRVKTLSENIGTSE